MTNRNLLAATALQTGAFIFFASATPSFAQTTTTTCPLPGSTAPSTTVDPNCVPADTSPAAVAANTDTQIVVTGSRIRRPNLDSSVPITSVAVQDLTSRGEVSLGDALNDLPSLRSTFSQANSTGSIGTAGLSILDLRGLGTNRTLVLVNGRRTVSAQPGNFNVDVNTIPVDLLDRVDVVTGGNSAVYGSDAVAGVVNFILKRDYEGVKVRGQIGTSTYNDRDNKFASIVAGHNFLDGKLNLTGAFEYAKSDAVYYSDRPYLGAYTGVPGFYTSQITTAPNRNFDGIPNTSFWSVNGGNTPGITFGNISTGGYVLNTCPTSASAAVRALVCTGAQSPTGGNIVSNYAFNPDGTLSRDVPYFDNRPIGGGVFGGLSATGVEDAMLLPGLERFVGNVFLNGNISPAFKPFVEASYVRVNATQQSTQPTFVASNLSPVFSLNNPFLSSQARALISQFPATVSAASCQARTGTSQCFTMQRFNNDLGTRAEDHKRTTYRVVVGARGELSSSGNLNYEASLNYGHTRTYYETGGNVLIANFNRASDARLNSAGQIVCGVNADASTTNDDPSCVPLNLFGYGASSQAARDYVLYTSSRVQKATQLDGVAFISGDSSGFFRLPGGPIGFSLGYEHREEKASSVYDDVTASGATFLNAFQPFLPPKLVTNEGFGEVRLPILADLPGIKELTVEGAARYSKYRGIKGVWAYNAGATYSPFSGLKLRAGYARSVRTPTLSDAYAAETQTFANGLTDPCDQPGGTNASNNISSNPNRAANCAAAGVPTTVTYVNNSGATVTVPFTNVPGSGVLGINRGNPDLVPEKGDSLTIGGVVQPSFMPGFALTVDYYRIKVRNVISGLSGQQIINRCYDDPTGINNEFCAAIARQTSTNPLINGTFAGQTTRDLPNLNRFSFPSTGNAFINQPYNFAALIRRGVDFDASYSRRLWGNVRFSGRAIVSVLLQSENFSYLTQPDRSDKIDQTFGDPRWGASWNANLDFGNVDFTYSGNYVGRQSILSWETQFSHQGRGPTNPDARPIKWYPSQITHSARVNWDVLTKLRLYAGVDNIANKRPPYDLTGVEGGSPFNPTGRFFYGGAELKFR
ncbi:TonB-dependent receptor domain-containing protein [Sphingomonas flavescens]|uniref:TonB-dependent receptor domain-containing protein n=1 Tax=Sphingomonas flavescens TaxID=3132797 RepID=UPI002805000A|nr:TonB-dependent receptor [Sphingomonas limnosediminicola]